MDEKKQPDELVRYPLWSVRSTRLWICIPLSAGFAGICTMRTDLSLTMVCMVNGTAFATGDKRALTNTTSTTNEKSCPNYDSADELKNAGYNGDLLWSPSRQSMLFSATVYGSIITGTFAGVLADKFGPKTSLLGVSLLGAIMTLLTPMVAKWSYSAFFVLRFIIGCGEGFVFPALSSVASRWFVPEERSTMAALYTSGNQIGISIISVVGAYLCSSSFGWEAVFYILGPIAILWSIVWYFVASNYPSKNKWISREELQYMEAAIPNNDKKSRQSSLPWRSILTSIPVYATIAGLTANSLAAGIMAALLPTFLKEYLRLPLLSNGFYTTLPFISQLIAKNGLAILAGYMKRNKITSHTTSVKIFQVINSVFCGLSLISLIVIPSCTSTYLVIFGIGNATAIYGYYTSILSLAPAYSGTICSFSMTIGFIGNLAGLWVFSALSELIHTASVFSGKRLHIAFYIVHILSFVTPSSPLQMVIILYWNRRVSSVLWCILCYFWISRCSAMGPEATGNPEGNE